MPSVDVATSEEEKVCSETDSLGKVEDCEALVATLGLEAEKEEAASSKESHRSCQETCGG